MPNFGSNAYRPHSSNPTPDFWSCHEPSLWSHKDTKGTQNAHLVQITMSLVDSTTSLLVHKSINIYKN